MSRKRKKRLTFDESMKRNRRAAKLPLFIVLAIAAAAALGFGVYYIINTVIRNENTVPPYENMSSASLPLISMNEHGFKVNTLHGYTGTVNADLIRENTYILDDDLRIPLIFDYYTEETGDIDFRISESESGLLKQSGTASPKISGDQAFAEIRVDNVIDPDRDYILDMILKREGENDAHYYCRLRLDSNNYLDRQIDTILKFNSETFNSGKERSEEYILGFMATNPLIQTNEDLSFVSLYSNRASVMWGNTNMSLYNDIEIHIIHIDGPMGYFRLNFMTTRREGDREEYYYVSEFYRVRISDVYEYILDYERETRQAFVPDEDIISSGSAILGITTENDISMLADKEGKISCFEAGGELWAMYSETNNIRKIFSFSSGLEDARGNFYRHGYKVLDVSDGGDIQFLIYGYMNGGAHEGECGIGLYTYHTSGNTVMEDMFIPSSMAYDCLVLEMGNICHLNDSGILFIEIGSSLYSVNSGTGEIAPVFEGLTEGNHMVHTDGNIIAWHEGGSENDAESICVLDMDTGSSYTVHASDGCRIKVLGFLNSNLVYGQGEAGNIWRSSEGSEYLLMTDMYVVDSSGAVQMENASGAGFFISSEDEYNRVILNKVIKKGGSYVLSENFTVFANELDYIPKMKLYSEYEEVKRTVYSVIFAEKTESSSDLSIGRTRRAFFTDSNSIAVDDIVSPDYEYYIFAKGHLQGFENDPADAIISAYSLRGMAADRNGQVFYERGLMAPDAELSAYEIEQAKKNIEAGDLTDVSGIGITEALYFCSSRKAVVWEYAGSRYLITAYKIDDYSFLDLRSGETSAFTEEYLQENFASGRCFIADTN